MMGLEVQPFTSILSIVDSDIVENSLKTTDPVIIEQVDYPKLERSNTLEDLYICPI